MATAVEILFSSDIRQVESAIATVGKSLDKLARSGQASAERSVKSRIRGEQDASKAAERAAKDAARSKERIARDEIRVKNQINALEVRDWQKTEREKTRAADTESRNRARIARQEMETVAREHEKRARTFGRHVGGAVTRTLGFAGRMAATVGAIGGGFTIADTIQSGMRQEAQAGQIVRSAQNTGGLNKGNLLSTAHATTVATGIGKEDVLAGLDEFVKKTGDLKVGVDLLKDLARYSAASGASLADMGSVAAEAYQQLGNVDETKTAMLALAGQGKSGAIDIRDLAQYGARVTSMANMFEGGAGKNIESFGVIAQIAKAKGGATDAAEATEAVSALFGEMSTHQKDFAGLGVQLRGKGGKMRPIEDILTETVSKEKGDPLRLEKLFGRRASKAVLGLGVAYNEAGGGAAGTAAVRGMLTSGKTAMTEGDVDAAVKDKLTESESQLAIAMENLHDAVNTKLLPKMPELIGAFTKLIPAISKIVELFANFPVAGIGLSIAAAIGANIAAAELGNKVTNKIISLLGGGGGGSGPGPVGKALGVGAAALTGYEIGAAYTGGVIEPMLQGEQRGERRAESDAMNADSVKKAVLENRMSPEDAEKMRVKMRAEMIQLTDAGGVGKAPAAVLGSLTGTGPGVGQFKEARAYSENAAKVDEALMQLKDAISQKAMEIRDLGFSDGLANQNHPGRGGIQ